MGYQGTITYFPSLWQWKSPWGTMWTGLYECPSELSIRVGNSAEFTAWNWCYSQH